MIQSILIPVKYYNLKTASEWIKKKGYKLSFRGKKPELIGKFYHFRQSSPKGAGSFFIVKKKNILFVIKT